MLSCFAIIADRDRLTETLREQGFAMHNIRVIMYGMLLIAAGRIFLVRNFL